MASEMQLVQLSLILLGREAEDDRFVENEIDSMALPEVTKTWLILASLPMLRAKLIDKNFLFRSRSIGV